MAEQSALRDKLNKLNETSQGRMVLVGGAVGLLVLIIAIVMILARPSSEGTTPATPPVAGADSSTTAGAVPASGQAATGQATPLGQGVEAKSGKGSKEDVDNFDVFQTRDPFKPLIEARDEEQSLLGSAPTTETSLAVAKGALQLDSIITRGDVSYADITYAGKRYELAEGERVDDSPYQVLQINETNAIFLYGDDRVFLKPGEKVYK